ncbi:DUF4097 family beta strand repeat-containing protein [Pseudoalteromonas sp. H103]|uniref:DUF4097 family beta strand repeat-containing protein n=1 Tax=Pseudoalteromonas sp. H103 TaxID=1761893 RepID=UPI000732122F|nr:DUF4097 family beta strand repeat-containing protein [Pseudoalteromonas sp. H103]KTF15963.1 hypothetical protein ATS74_16715 [Pseudoalteromonas sp. H103]
MSSSTVSNITKPLSLIGGILLLSGCVFHISPSVASVKQTQQLSLPSSNLEYLNVLSGTGSLEIKGSPNATSISVDATIFTADIEDEYTLTLEQNGKQATLVANNNTASGMRFYSGQSPHIDLVVTVPSNLMLDIDDGSGDIAISAMQNNIDIEDGSGSLSINSAKNLTIEDGSGDITLENITGNLALTDGSGSVNINNVSGNAEVDDGSGDMRISNVRGTLTVEDGSGSIAINNINGAVDVDDNSGDLVIEHVQASVTIEDGSGNIRVNHAKGLTITESGSGDVSIDNISGPVKVAD